MHRLFTNGSSPPNFIFLIENNTAKGVFWWPPQIFYFIKFMQGGLNHVVLSSTNHYASIILGTLQRIIMILIFEMSFLCVYWGKMSLFWQFRWTMKATTDWQCLCYPTLAIIDIYILRGLKILRSLPHKWGGCTLSQFNSGFINWRATRFMLLSSPGRGWLFWERFM